MRRNQKFTTEWISASDIPPHRLAQRRFNQVFGDFIAKNVDPDKIGIVTVVEHNGKTFTVDGQHRRYGVMTGLGADQQMLCHVRHVQPGEDADKVAASLFLALNNHKVVRAFDKFKVRLVEGEQNAVAIMAILERRGLSLSPADGALSIRAVDALDSVFKRSRGAATLDRVLAILRGAFHRDKQAFDGALIRGCALLCTWYNGEIDDAALVSKLAKNGRAAHLIGQARDARDFMKVAMPSAVAELMLAIYNKGMRAKLETVRSAKERAA